MDFISTPHPLMVLGRDSIVGLENTKTFTTRQMVSCVLNTAKNGIRVLSDDTDVYVLLVY